jgi:ribosomal protein S18 acetylase RimI-like enzyme
MTTLTASNRRASTADSPHIIRVVSEGFVTDPVFVWMFPESTTRPYYTRRFFEVLAPSIVELGESDINDTGNSVGLWLSVDPATPANPDEDAALLEQLAEACGPHVERLGLIAELMEQAHPHDEAHAYLNFVSTLPEFQGQGFGRRLLQERLEELDAEGRPAYLEATTLRSAKLYESLGFQYMPRKIDLPWGPSMYPMWREPGAGR